MFEWWMASKQNPRQPQKIDVYVGMRLRIRRKALGFSQKQLATRVSISFQQLQKYESGANRIGAGRLYQLALALSVGVEFFYKGLPNSSTDDEPDVQIEAVSQIDEATWQTAMSISAIENRNLQAALHVLINELAQNWKSVV